MFNVVSKSTVAVAMMGLICSCGGGNASKQLADGLVASADSAITAGDYPLAVELLDTLQARYPAEIEAQRKGMNLRPRAIEGNILAEIQTTDSILAYYTYLGDSVMQYFSFINNPELVEGYYVIKEYTNTTLFNRTGVEARVSPDGEFYMISSLTSKSAKHTSISVKNAAGEASTATVGYDGDRNYRSGGTEMITFIGAECDTIGQFLLQNPGTKSSLTFKGSSSCSVPLSANDSRSITLAYQLSKAMTTKRTLAAKRDLLDRQLQIARDQIARTATE